MGFLNGSPEPPAGFEPAAYGVEVRRSVQTELRGHLHRRSGRRHPTHRTKSGSGFLLPLSHQWRVSSKIAMSYR